MEVEREIEVEFESNKKDFQRVLLWYHWKRMVLEFGLMILAGISVCYFLDFSVLATFVLFITISILVGLDFYKRCFLQADKLKEIAKPSKTIFSEQGIESKTPVTVSKRDWESYANIYETAEDFIFLHQENAFAAVPKRFFKNQNEIEALRELVNKKLGGRAKLQN